MKVKELIKMLKDQNPEEEVEISIGSYNREYPVYCLAQDNGYGSLTSLWGRVRIECYLPNDEKKYMIITEKKKA